MLSVYLPQLETLSFIKCQLIVSLSSICLSIVHQLTLLIIIALKEDKNEKSLAIPRYRYHTGPAALVGGCQVDGQRPLLLSIHELVFVCPL